MATSEHPKCYGRLFPGLLALPEDRPASGKVFTVLLERAGGMWRGSRSVTADMERWDECLECEGFDGCYKLSMAKLALESAVQDR
jgi:hypothetical protein